MSELTCKPHEEKSPKMACIKGQTSVVALSHLLQAQNIFRVDLGAHQPRIILTERFPTDNKWMPKSMHVQK